MLIYGKNYKKADLKKNVQVCEQSCCDYKGAKRAGAIKLGLYKPRGDCAELKQSKCAKWTAHDILHV